MLHGIDLDLRPGERLAVVGPSGAGKSTLGRLLAGVHPPRTGRVTVGGVPLVDLPLDDLRRHVVLVTQEHHVFVGSVAENLLLARPAADRGRAARGAVSGRRAGLGAGPAGRPGDRSRFRRARRSARPRPSSSPWRGSCWPTRTPWCWTRRRRCSTRAAARHLERSLAAVLHGRTVVAIAHRLHTAHDADRVAVVEDGLVSELGSHDELVASGGAYAALWDSWSSDPSASPVH